MFVLIHNTQSAYISTPTYPPRLCEFTKDEDEAFVFDNESEARHAAEYISKYAFLVHAIPIKEK